MFKLKKINVIPLYSKNTINSTNFKLTIKPFNLSLFKNSLLKKFLFVKTEKSVKWYWREINYDMGNNEIYKNYLIRHRVGQSESEKENDWKNYFSKISNLLKICFNSEPHYELLPLDNSGNPSYDSCLIWLYDGDHVDMFIDHLLEFNNFPPRNFKIVFYRAPFNPITWNSIVLQRNWFNILNFPDASGYRDINKNEIENFNSLIQREIRDQYNIIGDYSRIFLGGFSQSGCMALYSTLTCKENLGGCVSFSGFNFDFTPLDQDKKKIPILCVNGTKDEVVILKHARNSFNNLVKLGFNIKFIEEPGLSHFFTRSGLKYADKLLRKEKIEF